jgi:DNA (cytosine-5)-methyltransferase 1
MTASQLTIPLLSEMAPTGARRVETFACRPDESLIERHVQKRDGSEAVSSVAWAGEVTELGSAFDLAWLRSQRTPDLSKRVGQKRIADLFSGCGAMTLGVWEACRALNLQAIPVLAVDTNKMALNVYKANFPDCDIRSTAVEEIVDSDIGARTSKAERLLRKEIGTVDLLIGGPPCQGHSDLNNHTRRKDPRNALLLRMVRFAEIFKPEHIIIENVPGIVYDQDRVVITAKEALVSLGYHVDWGFLDARKIGVAQRRRRFMLIASISRKDLTLAQLGNSLGVNERSFGWACGDLTGIASNDEFDKASKASTQNTRRMAYLFEHDIYDLPDEERPDCHREKPHSYRSVYGRIKWDDPVQTITGGFRSMGQGRYVHPREQRTITPHEAARLQFIPDFFDFNGVQKTALAELIGNAVPPKLSYAAALDLLR